MNLAQLLTICEGYMAKIADTTMMAPTVDIEDHNGHLRLRFEITNNGKVYLVFDINEKESDVKTYDCIESYSEITRDLANFKKTVQCDYENVECVLDVTDKWGMKRFPLKNIILSINTADNGEALTCISFA